MILQVIPLPGVGFPGGPVRGSIRGLLGVLSRAFHRGSPMGSIRGSVMESIRGSPRGPFQRVLPGYSSHAVCLTRSVLERRPAGLTTFLGGA